MEGIRDDVAFVFHNGRSYTMTEVAIPTVDSMIHQIKEVAERKVESITAALRRDFVDESFRLSREEHTRIVRAATQNTVSIPNDRAGLPLVAINNVLCPVRSMLYAPSIFKGSINGWRHWVNDPATWTLINEKLGYDIMALPDVRRDTTSHFLNIKGAPNLLHTAVTLYSICNGAMLCNRKGFHTTGRYSRSTDTSIEWQQMCIGNTPADVYWGLAPSDFREAINSINLDSMANNGVQVTAGNRAVHQLVLALQDVVVTHIRPTEAWEAA